MGGRAEEWQTLLFSQLCIGYKNPVLGWGYNMLYALICEPSATTEVIKLIAPKTTLWLSYSSERNA